MELPSKLPFYKQETSDSCVPACLRMVFSSIGFEISEAELRLLCDCTFEGTTALKAVDAARKLGFPGTRKYNLSLTELDKLLADGVPPIVFVEMYPIAGIFQVHALIVTQITPFSIQVIDPEIGERVLPTQVFRTAWEQRNNLAILIKI